MLWTGERDLQRAYLDVGTNLLVIKGEDAEFLPHIGIGIIGFYDDPPY